MPCTNEPVWDIAAFVLTAIVFWGAGLYVSKRVRAPYFSQLVKPALFPSYAVYELVLLLAQLLFAVAAYWVWLDGFWAAHTFALAMFVCALFIAFVSMFITWVFFQPFAVFIGGIVLIVAGVAAIFSAIWMFFAGHFWAFAFALICAAVYVFFGVLTIWFSIDGNTYRVLSNGCRKAYKDAWPKAERDYNPCAASESGGGGVVVGGGDSTPQEMLDDADPNKGFVQSGTTPAVSQNGKEFLASISLEVPSSFGKPPVWRNAGGNKN